MPLTSQIQIQLSYLLPTTSFSSHPPSKQTIALFSFGGILLINLSLAIYRDYKTYLSYGPGGLPYNIRGWFISSAILRPLSTDVLNTGLYDWNPDKRIWLPPEWPPYDRGKRPKIGPHPLPQRQLDQIAPGECKEV
jgi:hypothetical protein